MKTQRWLASAKRYFSSSISKKIIIPYALLTVVLAAMGIFIVTRLVANSFEDRLKNQLLEAGRVVSDEIVNRERRRLEVERVVANTQGVPETLIDRDVEALEELVYPIIANSRDIDSIIIVDTQGKEVLRLHRESASVDALVTTKLNSGLDLASVWPSVRQILENPDGDKTVQLVEDPGLGELIIYTVGPIQTDQGVVGAALVGTYLSKDMALFQNLALAPVTLFDRRGRVLKTTFGLSEAEQAAFFNFFTPERYRQVIQSKGVTLLEQTELPETVTVRDRNYRLAYGPFILRNEIVGVYAVALGTNFITDTTDESRNLFIAVFSGGVIIVFAIGYGVASLISRPILQLVQTSLAIAGGDLNRRSGLKGEDEIGILASTFDDMTDKLQHLLQLQQEEASKLTAILSSIADGVIVQDLNGDVLIMNPAAQQILEVMGRNFMHASHSPDEGEKKVLTEAEADSMTYLLKNLDTLEFRETGQRLEVGQQVLSALSAPVITPDGIELGEVVVLRDITREVESEKLKDEFITSISHELKTPLTAIKGYNSLLKMMLQMSPSDKMGARQLSIIETMEKELNDLDNLIQAMLDLSQIDAGELGIDREPIDLSALVETEAENWKERMEARELSFTTHLPEETIWIEGDQQRLTRVVRNLLKNAHDYTLPGGNVEVLIKRANGLAQVEIKDNGVGISMEDQRFLFRRFFRAIHEENTFEVSGAGLGLYTSKAIVAAHDGELLLRESEPHKGSTFSFALPIIEEPQEDDDYDLEDEE